MMKTWEEQVNFVRGMSAAAAKILWILVLSGRSLTNHELQFACGLSDKPVSKGLAWLEFQGLVQNNGHHQGWSLAAGMGQLPLPLDALPDGGRNISELETVEDRNISELESRRVAEDRNISELGGQEVPEDRNIAELLSSSSSSSSKIQSKDLSRSGREEEERRKGGQDRNISELEGEAAAEICRLLVAAGVGERSRKMQEILEAGLDLAFVRGHVAYRQRLLAQGEAYPTGWLITKLLDGDAVPVCDCSDCDACDERRWQSHIPAEYRDIVKR